jgi:hypothetical protein
MLERGEGMATQQAVNGGSQFCRDCGGPIQPQGGLSWCTNTTTNGIQQDPKDVCQNLTKRDRQFCEHCGNPVVGPVQCGSCHQPPTNP